MATIRDVARRAGVSTSTVSLTFGEAGRVSAETAARVWDAADALGYRPNPLAQSLKRGHARMIAVVVGDITNPFFSRLLKGIEREAIAAGYNVILGDTDNDAEREMSVVEQLAAQRIGGTIMTAHGSGPDYARRLTALPSPVVLVDHRIPGAALDFVGSDSRLAAAMLTEHLLRLGHRRIAQITGPPQLWTASQRIDGFREVMASAGVPVPDDMLLDGGYINLPAYEQTMRLMTRPTRPTAILAANNVMALGALQALQELGIDCPGEVSLATIDDVPWSGVIQPRLTMVRQDVERIAQIATGYLLDRMASREAIAPRETVLVPQLVLGTSTAAAPGR